MARKSDTRGRRIARTAVTITGDIRVLTTQELAEFVDPIELAGSSPMPQSLPNATAQRS
jgi:hypothetical protein